MVEKNGNQPLDFWVVTFSTGHRLFLFLFKWKPGEVHMEYLGFPLVGDRQYQARTRPNVRGPWRVCWSRFGFPDAPGFGFRWKTQTKPGQLKAQINRQRLGLDDSAGRNQSDPILG